MELKAGQKNMANEPMYKKIYEDLLDGIKVGTYPPGGRLPSEKELIDMYQVSRITVKRHWRFWHIAAVSFVSPEKVLLSYLRAIWKRHCRMKIL